MIWWKKALLALAIFVIWFFGLAFVGGQGYASQYFWASFSALAVGFAVAPFWRFHTASWYRWTTAALATANITALYILRNRISIRDLPAKGIFELLLIVDCMSCWAIMVGVYYTLHRRLPWQTFGD